MPVRAKKHLGQHFLKEDDIARRITEGLTLHRGYRDVLEVGPGTGALTRHLVDRDDIRKGFEYEKGDYVLLTDDEIDAVKLETRKTLDLIQFVDESEIPPLYYDTPYFVTPAGDLAEDAFRVIRDALRQSKKVGLGQLALRGKEYLVAVKPCGKGILLETLHYEDELKKSDSFFSEIGASKADKELLEVATALIDTSGRLSTIWRGNDWPAEEVMNRLSYLTQDSVRTD